MNQNMLTAYKEILDKLSTNKIRRFFYDCEFDESGPDIKLISIGIVSENGNELYLINKDYDWTSTTDWLRANVKPFIDNAPSELKISYEEIGKRIIEFIQPSLTGDVKLYGYYSAYDHVCLCKTFGTMMDLPDGMPMYTTDLKQFLDYFKLDKDKLMGSQEDEHDALADAKWNLRLYQAIKKATGATI